VPVGTRTIESTPSRADVPVAVQGKGQIIMGQFINLQAADGFSFPAYVAEPAGKPRGAVVVLQEIFGVNSHIRAVADGYAAEGYLAVAPAAFHRVKAGVELGYTADDMSAGIALKSAVESLPAPGVMPDIEAAVAYAARAGKVGVVGYCWGGLLTWRTACLVKGVSAAAPYYGGGVTSPAEAARQPLCPVMAHFGEKDHWIPMDSVQAFAKAQPGTEVHVYAADHGFNCDQRGSWDAPAAKLARERTLAFFAKHLG
jgi:carboxymethylenebutenolidase